MLLPVVSSLLVVGVAGAYAYWRVRTQRGLRIDQLVAATVVLQLSLVVPVAFVSWAAYRIQHPDDDWYDIVGFGGGALQLFAMPLVAVTVWLIGAYLIRSRTR